MKVYWSWESVPELADLPPRDRRRLWREAWEKVVWRWPVMCVGFVPLPAMLLGSLHLVGYLALAVGLGWPLALLLVGGVVGNLYGFILTQVGLHLARPYLRAARLAESQSGQPAGPGLVHPARPHAQAATTVGEIQVDARARRTPMATKTEGRRSWLMWLLRVSAVPLLLACLVGGVLMAVSLGPPRDPGTSQALWKAGCNLLALAGVLFIALLWGGVYLQVVEASRGMPGIRSVEEPSLSAEAAADWRALQAALHGLGFRPEGWFSLDDFDQTHVSPWPHEVHPAAAFVLYSPSGRNFRLRILRRFPSGGILISTTRLIDLSYPPPQGIYLQARKKASVAELWAWHLEAEALFPDAAGRAPSGPAPGGARTLFVEVAARWARHRRRDRTWLLAVEPFGECWRIYHLTGMPLARQFELGWTIPYWG